MLIDIYCACCILPFSVCDHWTRDSMNCFKEVDAYENDGCVLEGP